MTGEKKITVALVVNLPGGLTALTVPKQAELYDEEDQTRDNKRCIRLAGVEDPDGKTTDGHVNLAPWVTEYVKEVFIYTSEFDSLDLGSNGKVGLTGEEAGIWTKPLTAIRKDPIAPLTVENLQKAGLV